MKQMRVKANVEFVKNECEARSMWEPEMEEYCGKKVDTDSPDQDGDRLCHLRYATESWYFPASCLEEIEDANAEISKDH